jgi:peroxiredoxin
MNNHLRTSSYTARLGAWLIAAACAAAPLTASAEDPPAGAAPVVEASARLALGASLPMTDAKMLNVDDKQVSIADIKGEKGTLVIFTCNHCPFVKMWEGRIAEIGNAAKAQGVGVIAINANDPATKPEDGVADMKARAAELSLSFPYVVDAGSKVARGFGATRTPEVFLFVADGKIVYWGAVDDSADDPAAVAQHFLKDALTAVSAGAPVAVSETKAVGCSIKFYPQM